MTQLFFILLIVAFILVTIFPIRYVLILSLFWKIYKGRKWQEKRQRHNREICKIELQNLFEDLKIKIERDSSKKKKTKGPTDRSQSLILENAPSDLLNQNSSTISF